MNPELLDSMGWAMAEVYGAITDRLLINLAKYFPYVKDSDEVQGVFAYQARMLAQMGQVTRESADIIMGSLGGADKALREALEKAILDALKHEEPQLRKAAKQGLLKGAGMLPAELTPNQMQAFSAFYRQSADKLNLVNTVMLESTQEAYQATVADIVNRVQVTQTALNVGTGEVVTGVSTWNQAVRGAVQKMVKNNLTGFVDHGGHRWTPEAYAAMDIRTTMFNTARAAVWERADEYGADLYQVSSHSGARPLCYPWQGKVISRSDWSGEVKDIDGNTVTVYPQSVTSYGEAAGLFGVNCKHYPMTFIPGFSALRGHPQSEEENEKSYELNQEQRSLERKLREEKRDLAVMKAQGASADEIRAQETRVHATSAEIEEFCADHDMPRRRNRESAPVRTTWPDENGSQVTRFDGDYIDVNQVPPVKAINTLTYGSESGKIVSDQRDWSSATFQTEAKFRRHVKDHMAEFGYSSGEEYLEGARSLLNRPISDDIDGFTGKDGFVFRYDMVNNAFALGHPGGSISTFFKPVKGREYWNEQVELYKP